MYWTNGDAICVNGITSAALELTEPVAAASFTFEGILAEEKKAVYPATAWTSDGTVTIPATQDAGTNASFAAGALPMVAYAASGNDLTFKHTAAVIKLQLKKGFTSDEIAYADFFHHPWPRYRMSHSSTGQEFSLQGIYVLSKQHSLLARYQLKRKENADVMEPHHRVKLGWTYEVRNKMRFQTTGYYHNVLGRNGFLVSQNARYLLPKPNLTLNAQLGYFNTDDYLSRIYLQSPALYSTFSSSSYYGHGVLGVLTCRWKSKNEKLWLEGRYSLLHYFDRDEIGSGLQRILSPWKHDLSFQLRLKI